jgi:hypothetical protein
MTRRKDSYRAAMQRQPAAPPSPEGIVIRSRPVSVTIDLDPRLRRALTHLAPATVVRGIARQVGRGWPSKPAQGS